MVPLLAIVVCGALVVQMRSDKAAYEADLERLQGQIEPAVVRDWSQIPEDLENRSFTIDYFGMTWEGETSNLIDQRILYFGAWEHEVLRFLSDASAALWSGETVFVDVGANVGSHTLYMAKHAATVHAIEPWPPVLRRLRHLVEINELSNVVIHPVGVGSEEGSMPFFEPPEDNLGTGSFAADHGQQEQGEDLPIRPGDALFAEQGIDEIHLVKMDIEGYEKFALQGMRATNERDRPVYVMELNVKNEDGFHSREELEGAFPERYRFDELRETGVAGSGDYEVVPYGFGFERWAGTTLVIYPEELADRLPRTSR